MNPTGWFGLLLLVWLFFWLYRDYRLDLLRQRLFALRDELFDLVIDEKLPFDDPAYVLLRQTINGQIRSAHQYGFVEVLSHFIATRKSRRSVAIVNYESKLQKHTSRLNREVREKMQAILDRAHLVLFEHIILTSSILMVTLITSVVMLLLYAIKNVVVRAFSRMLNNRRVKQVFSALDCSAAIKAA